MFEKFEQLKSFIYRIFLIILFFVLAKSCVSDYVKGGDNEKISEYEKMIDENSFVYADISNKYTETTIASSIKIYKFDYSFSLNNQEYFGKITLNEIPNTNKLKLFYLKTNPNIVENDPWEAIKTEKGKGKISDLLIGIIWGLLCVLFSISFIRLIIDKTNKIKKKNIFDNNKSTKTISDKKTKEKKQIEEEISEEEKQRIAEEKERVRKEKEDPRRFMPK